MYFKLNSTPQSSLQSLVKKNIFVLFHNFWDLSSDALRISFATLNPPVTQWMLSSDPDNLY